MNKKAIVTHPAVLFIIAFILGFVLAYLIAQDIISLGFNICK